MNNFVATHRDDSDTLIFWAKCLHGDFHGVTCHFTPVPPGVCSERTHDICCYFFINNESAV